MRGRTQMQDVEFARDRNLGSSRSILSSWHPMCADQPSLLYPVALSFFPIQQPEQPTTNTARAPPASFCTGRQAPARTRGALPRRASAERRAAARTRGPLLRRASVERRRDAGSPDDLPHGEWRRRCRASGEFLPEGSRGCDVELCSAAGGHRLGYRVFLPFLFLFVLMRKVL
jgi:hypothetical protein